MKKVWTLLLVICLILAPLSTAFAAGDNKDLNILWSSGGNGNYVDYTAEQLKEKYGLDITLEYNSKAHEILRPQILGGNPPDIAMVQHSFFDYFAAIEGDSYTPIDSYMDLTVEGSDKTIREVANSDVIDSMLVDGEAYLLMSNMNVGGVFYNQAMFDEYGWEVPQTWDEFIALCETINTTTEIAPFIYPGMYPYYLQCFIMPQIASCGRGMDSIKDINNMTEGIWTSDEVKAAAERIQLMRDNGYFSDSLISLSHTEAQMEFINGNAAMIAAGSWLKNEMGDSWPEGFELRYMATPAADNADAEKFVVVSGNLFGFPSKAANKEWIGEFLQTYFSPESALTVARDCAVVISPAMVAETEEIRNVLDESVVSSFMAANDNTKVFMLYSIWYAEFHAEYQNQLTALISGDIDADAFCENMEKMAQEVRDDDFITKYVVS